MTSLAPDGIAARSQMKLALWVLSAMTAVLGSLALLTRSPSLAAWVDRQNEASCRQTRQILYHRGWFQAPEELWMYDRLPQADYAKGGVYLLGASCVEFATKLWELPLDAQALIHNYGIPASNPKGEAVLLRYLMAQRGMLKAEGEKTLVVFGCSYEPAFYPCQKLNPGLVNAWERHGFFACDPREGVRVIPVNPVSKFIEFEETHQAACLTRLQNIFLQQLSRWRHHGAEPPRRHNPALYEAVRRGEMGPDWQHKITQSVQVFRETIAYLQERHVQIRIVFMPEGSWEQELPFSPEYQKQIRSLCAEKHIPISDWSRMLTDDEMADSTHPNIFGMEKMQPAFLEIALPFLRSTHALQATAALQN
jgi:hypothetical protein